MNVHQLPAKPKKVAPIAHKLPAKPVPKTTRSTPAKKPASITHRTVVTTKGGNAVPAPDAQLAADQALVQAKMAAAKALLQPYSHTKLNGELEGDLVPPGGGAGRGVGTWFDDAAAKLKDLLHAQQEVAAGADTPAEKNAASTALDDIKDAAAKAYGYAKDAGSAAAGVLHDIATTADDVMVLSQEVIFFGGAAILYLYGKEKGWFLWQQRSGRSS